MEKPRPSAVAWGVIAAGVLAYDILAPEGEMLSEAVDRGLEKHPVLTTLAVGSVALHLLNVLPERIDPVHQIAVFGRRFNRA